MILDIIWIKHKAWTYKKHVLLPGISLFIGLCGISDAYAQNMYTGTELFHECWFRKEESMSGFKLASDNDNIFLITSPGQIFALEHQSGKTVWRSDLGGIPFADSYLFGDSLLIISTPDAEFENDSAEKEKLIVRKIDPKSGVTVAYVNIEGGGGINIESRDAELLIGFQDGHLITMNPDLKVIREINTGFRISSPLRFSGAGVVFGTFEKTLVRLRKNFGSVESQTNVRAVPVSIEVSGDGDVYVGDREGFVYYLKEEILRPVWKVRVGGAVSGIEIFESGVLVSSVDNFVYMFERISGNRIWKRKLAGRILGHTLLGGEYAAFTASGTNDLVILNLQSGRIVNVVKVGGSGVYFTSAPLYLKGRLFVPTNLGVYAYGLECRG